ncbi:hypothetical protein DCE79_16190 [Lysinibacillus sp. 2017]|uniref:hypothetical protein n=1 Tax=unclassified Lysinibacillus TaxID=2636778 RepID=UPI000D5263CA|nr:MULTISPECIES: hypothetical protein [unclassified Lysinibacillus]AWE08800.1 hypothetical protein DCE79_16190 [Lysinibacillus sp. 2017]TGN36123.1 hypothetical protein E4L99_06570 [Lysinibacillus sp. S2017]
MSEIDKRNRLGEEPFTYQIMKNGTVTINYRGKQIKVVKDKEAERLIARIKAVENNILEVQLLLAKITGNFKRGNEKLGKNKRK